MKNNSTLAFHNAPFFIIGGVAGALPLLALTVRNQKRREERENGGWLEARLEATPRREAVELLEKLSAVREPIAELGRVLAWRERVGKDDLAAVAAIMGVDENEVCERLELDAFAYATMISYFSRVAEWLEKSAPKGREKSRTKRRNCRRVIRNED